MMSAWGLWAYMFTYFFVILYAHSILIIMSLSPYLSCFYRLPKKEVMKTMKKLIRETMEEKVCN